MKLCFMCDLHLPFDRNALQYAVLDWAVENICERKPDCVIYAGDITCDGNADVYEAFIEKMCGIGSPFLFIPGNSDLRCAQTRDKIYKISSECRNEIDGVEIFAVNDSDSEISEEDFIAIEKAANDSIVFMHHPAYALTEKSRERFRKWREEHKNTMLFYGHEHKSVISDNSVSLQALDPDKAVGECPCITYYDTEEKSFDKAYYRAPVPTDLYGHFGISCYRAFEDIEFAVENRLKNIELRTDCINFDTEKLSELIEKWRGCGGENLSVHLPDIGYKDGEVTADERIDEYIRLGELVKVNRFTQHVPNVSVRTVREEENVLEKICEYLADKFNAMDCDVTIGVENMHMTTKDTADDNRRFGYVPEECIEFMEVLKSKCRHRVGINFDIGHARNNAPYSQTYQISTWLSRLGKHIVGYHLHQVTYKDGVFENHMPITDIYGHLISFASFFRCWEEGRINKAPVIFEMRPEGAYNITLNTFDNSR